MSRLYAIYATERNCVRKHGKSRAGLQRYYCKNCKKSFQIKYIYTTYESPHKETILSMTNAGKSPDEVSKLLNIRKTKVQLVVSALSGKEAPLQYNKIKSNS
ncbi:transposase [Leminorella grimontii]|uniref:transposase n=1 Tax=Leminorella grimontii TaxID=82981 RepID=UPI003F655C9E